MKNDRYSSAESINEIDPMDHLYPGVYRMVYPKVKNVVDEAKKSAYTISIDDVDDFVSTIVDECEIEAAEVGVGFDEEAEAVFNEFGGGRCSSGRCRRRRFDRNHTGDFARMLLLRELFGRGCGSGRC